MDRKTYMRNYQRQWIAKRRRTFFKGKSCVLCGNRRQLELDHIKRSDKLRRTDHNIWSWSITRQADEIAKCQVLCKKCHKEKSKRESLKEIVHGTRMGYQHYGCRCSLCTEAASNYRNNQRYRTGRRRPRSIVIVQGACTSSTSV